MTNKDKFVANVTALIEKFPDDFAAICGEDYADTMEYLDNLTHAITPKRGMSENAKKILAFMQENRETAENDFTANGIGESIFLTGRSVSGTMRKLINDGLVRKLDTVGTKFAHYGLTDAGIEWKA